MINVGSIFIYCFGLGNVIVLGMVFWWIIKFIRKMWIFLGDYEIIFLGSNMWGCFLWYVFMCLWWLVGINFMFGIGLWYVW